VSDEATVLVVDDEEDIVDLYSAFLADEYDVMTATGGEAALSVVDDDVDVVVLDRRMPDRSGDEVLEAIRDRGYDCRVVMITAVDPDFDIVEMGFDDYLVKPVSKEDLIEIVETVHSRSEYEADVQEYYSLTSKKALLEAEKSERELENSEEYADLVERVDDLSSRVDDAISGMSDHEDFVGAFQDLPGEGDVPDVDAPDPEN